MGFETLIVYVLWAILLAVKIFAFVDAIRRPADYFPVIGRQTKLLWVAITGVSVLAGLATSLALSIFGIAGTVISLIYLFDIRPKMIEITGRKY
jgi:hypothetical protein